MKKGRRFFTWPDLIFPIGINILVIYLLVRTVMVGGGVPIFVTSAMVGVFLGSGILFYLFRYLLTRSDFKCLGRLNIRLGDDNRPTEDMVNKWLLDLTEMWSNTAVDLPESMRKIKGSLEPSTLKVTKLQVLTAISGCYVLFVDKPAISYFGRLVYGYTQGSMAVVGNRDIKKQAIPLLRTDYEHVEKLFKHEVSHLILGWLGYGWNEKDHHDVFAQVGV